MCDLEIQTAPATDVRRVLRLALAAPRQTEPALERQVTAFIQYARIMNLQLNRGWVALRAGHPVAACLSLESPGRTAMLFLPDATLPATDASALDALLQRAVAEEGPRDLSLLQCLIWPEDLANGRRLTGAGFRYISTIAYMEADAGRSIPETPSPRPSADRWEWLTYDDSRRTEFAELINATYRDSLDCPKLTGLRRLDDVITGHQAVGRFSPEHWLLVRRNGHPAGCILFGESPLRPSWELTYMGVHPDHRLKGVGRLLLDHGLKLARRQGCLTITLAVDVDNLPAQKLYDSFGFVETTRRQAYVLPLNPTFVQP